MITIYTARILHPDGPSDLAYTTLAQAQQETADWWRAAHPEQADATLTWVKDRNRHHLTIDNQCAAAGGVEIRRQAVCGPSPDAELLKRITAQRDRARDGIARTKIEAVAALEHHSDLTRRAMDAYEDRVNMAIAQRDTATGQNARLVAERDQARRAADGISNSLDVLVTLARAAVRDADLGDPAAGVDHLREMVADLAEHAPALETYASGADLIEAETGKTTWAEVAS
jgi:hypothetical protein